MKSRSLPYVVALLAAAAVLAAVWVVDRLEQERFREASRASVVRALSTVRGRLEGSLNARLFLTRGLVGHVLTHPGIDEREFQALAKVLLAGQSAIRSIELAKNTVVTHIYPVEGNEKARGLRLLDLPDQRAAVQRALDTRNTVVAGPVDLVEGGVAFVSRTPIYLTPPGGPPASGRYWGLATILVDKNFLLEEAGLFDDSAGLQYGLRGKDGLGTQGEIFFGNLALFESHPVVLDVYLPNGSWQLAAIPVGGWAAVSPQVWPVRVGGAFFALLAAGLAYMVTLYQMRGQEREKALREAYEEVDRRVQERTAELSDSEERFRRVLETAPDGMLLVRPDGTIALANEQMEKLFGYSSEELIGQGVEMLALEGFRTEQVQRRRDDFGDSCVRPRGSGLELYGRRKDGSEVPVEIRLSPLETQEGVLVCAAIRDITERKRAEEALRESEDHFRRLAETTKAVPWEADAETWQFTYVGPQAVTVLGYPLDQWYEKDFWVAQIHPDDREFAIDFCKQSSSRLKHFEFEYRMVAKDGRIVWIHDIVSVESVDGAPKTLRGFMIDITERRRGEEALEKQRAFLRQVIDVDPNFIFAKDREGRFTLVNQAMADVYGTTVEDLLGKTDADFNPNVDEVEFFRRMDLDVMDTLQGRFIPEERVTDAQGKVRWLQTVKRPMIGKDGTANQVLGSATDITQRKRAEETLQKRTEQAIRYQAVLLELAQMDNPDLLAAQKRITEEDAKTLGVERVSIWLFNEDRSAIACQDLYRLSQNTHEKGLTLQARQYPRYFHALEESRTVAANDAQSDPRTNEFTEGYLRPFEITSMMDVPVWLHGKVVGIVCHEHTGPIREWKPEEQEFAASIADLVSLTLEAAERKRTEEALRDLTGRLIGAQEEERRRLARELHDDLTQRLAVVAIEAGKVEQQLQGGAEPVLEGLRRMKQEMIELSAVVHGISRQLHPSILDDLGLVNAIEAECVNFSQREGIQVKFTSKNVPATLPRDLALCLYRIAQESLRNIAKHAKTDKAVVTLAGTDGGILLSVRDYGMGFDPARVRGNGGLGLISMAERVRLIQGDLSVESRPGQGTRIEVRVPLVGGDE